MLEGSGEGCGVAVTHGQRHGLSEPSHCPRHPRWETSLILPKSTRSQYRVGLPVPPLFLQMIMDFTSLALTLTPLEAKQVNPHPCQAENSVCLLVQVETGSKSQRHELSEVLSAITLENSLA